MASDEALDLSNAGKANCCQTAIEYDKCYLIWLVKNFVYCRQPTGEALSSCIFSSEEAGSLKFRLDVYPRGIESPTDVVFGIRLITDKDDVRAFVQYDCLFVGKDQKPYYRKQGKCLMTPGKYSHYVTMVNREELLSKMDELMYEKDVLYLACALRYSFKEETGSAAKITIKSQL